MRNDNIGKPCNSACFYSDMTKMYYVSTQYFWREFYRWSVWIPNEGIWWHGEKALWQKSISELRTILLKRGDELLFISNEKIGSSEDSEETITYDEAYLDEHAEEMWDILYKEKFSTYEPVEMRHGLGAIFSVVLQTGEVVAVPWPCKGGFL